MADKPFLRVMLMANTPLDWGCDQCPVLALSGGLDHQVPAKENLAGIAAAFKAFRYAVSQEGLQLAT